VGLGFTIVFTVTRIINFAQGEFVMLGGMLSWAFFTLYGVPQGPALILAILVATIVGAVLYFLAIRPARKASVVSLIIITIGASILIRGIVSEVWREDFVRNGTDVVRPPYFTGEEPLHFLGASIEPQRLWIVGTTILVAITLHLFFSYTMVGKALKACSVNRIGATLAGINPTTMALIAFAMAAALGAIGGIVVAPQNTTWVEAGLMLGLNGFVAAAIGGFRSQLVTVVGGIGLGILEQFAIRVDWAPFSSGYSSAIALVVLLVVLLARSGKLAEEERTS
jgi:branched-chain amino acid transport system permease protein